jgi:hypothetical protein
VFLIEKLNGEIVVENRFRHLESDLVLLGVGRCLEKDSLELHACVVWISQQGSNKAQSLQPSQRLARLHAGQKRYGLYLRATQQVDWLEKRRCVERGVLLVGWQSDCWLVGHVRNSGPSKGGHRGKIPRPSVPEQPCGARRKPVMRPRATGTIARCLFFVI